MSEARSRSTSSGNPGQQPPGKRPENKPAAHEEDIVGKAYDSRLMGRLLKYLRPYKWQAGISLAAILLKALADILGPYLTKVAVDRYMTHDPTGQSSWLARHLSAAPARGITRATCPRTASPSREGPTCIASPSSSPAAPAGSPMRAASRPI